MSNEQKWAPWLVRVYNGWRCANTFAQGIRTSCCAFILQTTAWHRQLPTAVSSLGRMQKSFPPHFASLRPKKLVSDFRSSSSQEIRFRLAKFFIFPVFFASCASSKKHCLGAHPLSSSHFPAIDFTTMLGGAADVEPEDFLTACWSLSATQLGAHPLQLGGSSQLVSKWRKYAQWWSFSFPKVVCSPSKWLIHGLSIGVTTLHSCWRIIPVSKWLVNLHL